MIMLELSFGFFSFFSLKILIIYLLVIYALIQLQILSVIGFMELSVIFYLLLYLCILLF